MNWLQRRVRPEQIRELSLLILIVVAVIPRGAISAAYAVGAAPATPVAQLQITEASRNVATESTCR